MGNLITLYHNTSNKNAISISKEGIKGGMRLNAYGKGSEAEGAGVWCTNVRGYGYGGATITFQIDEDERELRKQNDTEYIVYRDIKPEEIIDIDLVVSTIPCNPKRKDSINSTVESDIPEGIKYWGIDDLLKVFGENSGDFAPPYDLDQLKHLIETGEKYCKGTIKLTEGKLLENLTDQANYLYTLSKEDPKYKDKITNIDISETLKGEKKLTFKVNSINVLVLEYPKKDKCFYYYVDGVKQGYESSVYNIVSKLLKENKSITKLKESKRKYCSINRHGNRDKSFVLKGIIDGKRQELAYGCSRQELEELKEKILSSNSDYNIWVDENDNVPNASYKLEEASRNELLAKAKAETITRYNKSAGYKGFSLVDIDTTAVKTRDVIIITNRVGDYFDTIELEDILYWVGLEVDNTRDKKMGLEVVRRALLGAMDGMDIKVDCECGDWKYRFKYMATILDYNYGKPENRPSNITNPNGYGALCKHLISLLSNKSWVKQVASTLQQWIVDNIEWVRDFLKVKEEDFQLPDEYARYLGKHGALKKTFDKLPNEEDEEEQEDSADSNEVEKSDTENDEETNDTHDEEIQDNQDEELEEK